MHIIIDGRKLSAKEGDTILAVAKRAGIEIPTLCHHEALEPVGACRLCMVEVTHPDWNGWKGLVTSCLYPVEDGLEVATHSERVLRQRQTILDLLVARCPESAEIRALADAHGEVTEYKSFEDGSKCIMCYLCTRACAAVGAHAISAVNRGTLKEIAAPFHENPDACLGCGACYNVCPTGHIEMEDAGMTRKIWGREFKMVACDTCGSPIMTEEYRAFAIENRALPESYYTTCADCKRASLAPKFARVGS
jgi:bidirectional [NiFe] hydrogenase diaphorase subunit